MNEVDRQLRDLLDAAVGDPPHRVSVAAVRRRVFRRRLIEYVSAATGVAVIAAAVPAGIGALGHDRAPATGSATSTVYVLSGQDTGTGTLTPVPSTTDIPGQPIPLGPAPGPWTMAMTPDGKTVYVGQGTDSVTPVSTVTNEAGKPIPLGQRPDQILITPDGKTAYVLGLSLRAELTPITTATNTPGKAINLGLSSQQADSMAITPDGKTLYVGTSFPDSTGSQSGPGYLVPISTATNAVGTPIRIDMDHPWQIVVSPDGKTVYVIGTTTGDQTQVSPVATATNTPGPVVTIDQPASYQAITPDGKTIYFQWGNPRGVIPFATATGTVGKLIPTNDLLWDTPDDNSLYVFRNPRATPGQSNCTNPGGVTAVPTVPGDETPGSTAANLPGRQIRLSCIASIFAIGSDGQTVWAAAGNWLTPVSTATGISGKPIDLGNQILAIAVTP